jgi:hypothetical protein
MPPLRTMRRGASRAVTVTGKARPGATSVRTVIFGPSAIRPATTAAKGAPEEEDESSLVEATAAASSSLVRTPRPGHSEPP